MTAWRWAIVPGCVSTLASCASTPPLPTAPRPANPPQPIVFDPAVDAEQVGNAGIVSSHNVVVSPDGATLLFTENEPALYPKVILGLDLASEAVTEYVRVPEGRLHDPAWLPTPGAFFFVQDTSAGRAWQSRIARHDPGAAPEAFTVLTTAMAAGPKGSLRVAPDGVRILLATKDQIALARVDSEVVVPLAAGMEPTWSPDTKRIAYLTFEDESHRFTILVREDDGRTWPLALDARAVLDCPAFSPDGASIAYLRATTDDQYEIWLATAQPGGASRPLVRGTQGLGCPAWAPDGTFYVVAGWRHAASRSVLLHVRLAR
ncbi:MAG TPA: LpqB family beta-propeller domain-containing protein [Polyangiaceae bacterium]